MFFPIKYASSTLKSPQISINMSPQEMYLCRQHGHWFLFPPIKIHHLNMVVLFYNLLWQWECSRSGYHVRFRALKGLAFHLYPLLGTLLWLYQVQKQSLAHRGVTDHMEDGLANNQYQLSAAAVSLTPGKATERMRSPSPAQVAKLESHENTVVLSH